MMTFDEWLEIGLRNGYCSPTVCSTHDALPMTEEEDAEWEDGGDPCCHVVRLYPDLLTKQLVDENRG